MRTIAKTALLVTLIAVGAAPAAEARAEHRQDAREVKALAKRLEHATDELQRDARRAAGEVDRHEARALHAIYRLERAADELRRQVSKRDAFGREVRRDFQRVEDAYQAAFHDARRTLLDGRRSHQLRKDFRRVDQLIASLEDSFPERRRIARHGRDRERGHTRIARR